MKTEKKPNTHTKQKYPKQNSGGREDNKQYLVGAKSLADLKQFCVHENQLFWYVPTEALH